MIENTGNDAYSNVVVLEVSGQPSGYTVYPNPTADLIYVDLIAEKAESLEIELIDILARTILKKNFSLVSGKNQLQMDLKKILSGTYFLRVNYKSSNISFTEKITKK
jgi:hypothetical protein